MHTAIEVDNLSKLYRVNIGRSGGDAPSLQHSLWNLIKTPFHRLRHSAAYSLHTEDFWALREIDFEVPQGQVLGFIGQNGAGKSTLLKILSRITDPTHGEAVIRGRVASLLEVGTGFHPELTGRENIYLNSSILGMTRREIASRFDQIVEFSGVSKFLDTPVKRYSSGMRVRLAFSVAAHLEPEILIIDEVLAVGDAEFQARCLGKMESFAGKGRTVLFVSHNMIAIRSLCQRVILLEHGQIKLDGDPADVIPKYLGYGENSLLERQWDPQDPQLTNGEVRLLSAQIRPASEDANGVMTTATPLELTVEYEQYSDKNSFGVIAQFIADDGKIIFPTSSSNSGAATTERGHYRITCEIPERFLNSGTYHIALLLVKDNSLVVIRAEHALSFEVEASASKHSSWHGRPKGYITPSFSWKQNAATD